MGEPLFEFAWRRDGTIKPGIGGDVSNCAVAAARSGAKAGMITRLGEDSLGERIRSLYHDEGIATTHVIRDAAAPTGIYFIEYGPDGHSFSYRRAGSAACRLASSDLAPGMFAGVSFLHLSGISQAISESCRDASFTAMEMARSAGAKVSFDTNLRRSLWTPAAAGKPCQLHCHK
ncbi:sugar kinase [Mesorhizobium sp. M0204]|uniref:sugar kinase n=1 Tax=Mesorhizobium sp. M0204 TaxID=2956913 RepID=UPI0033383B41